MALVTSSPVEILKVEDAEAGYGHVMSGVPGNEVEGSFYWKAPEGDDISLTYTAGAEGYMAEGEHLPVSPEVPLAPEMALPVMVDFTPEVAAARSSFMEKFNEAKMKAEVAEERRRREAEDEPEAPAPVTYLTQPQVVYNPYLPLTTVQHLSPLHVSGLPVQTQLQKQTQVFPVQYPVLRYPGIVWSYPGDPLTPTVSVVPADSANMARVLPNDKLEGEDEPAALEF